MGAGGARCGAGRPAYRPADGDYPKLDIRRMGIKQGNQLAIKWGGSEQTIRLISTPCNYGGVRWWFSCPCCNRRAAVLFIMGVVLRCATCSRMSYKSQRVGVVDRAWNKQWKLEAKLIDGWQKPKSMRWATFERLQAGIEECERQKDIALLMAMARLA